MVDAIVQPSLTTSIELALWFGILTAAGVQTLNGYSRASYLTYVLWATFVSRVTSNWMYEYRMSTDVETGEINAILVRPMSYYEHYLFQFLGYKAASCLVSFTIPVVICFLFPTTILWARLPAALALIALYLVFAHTLSFFVATLSFFMTRAQSITTIKNMILWVLTGEMFPLDLIPEPLKSAVLHLPFACGVYVPVGLLSGRIGWPAFWSACQSLVVGIAIVGGIAAFFWRRGLRAYTGVAA